MWRAIKAELVYFLPWLLGGLGIAAFVVVVLSVLVRFLEDGDGPPMFVVTMFPFIAGMVVAFIAQSYRVEERRARMLLAGPLTPRQLAGVTVLLPVCFIAMGALAATPMIWLATLITGKFQPSDLRIAAGFAGQFWAYAQLGPLAQESTAARRQLRSGAAITGWGVFVLAILMLAASQFVMHLIYGYLGIAVAIITAMAAAAILFVGRTDYTR
jgi:hypothetical protein